VSRTCATALALVNWKGVFYERYLLDRHVTALEGANGAGKTTVMIAAYVVLLPDLARLRFTNLGETAATGGDRGLYGRLGEAGRPSYAALELELGDGARIVAGVQLVRKAEPTLELTPFIVSGVDLQGSLKELLLVSSEAHDAVPELDDVRAAAARLGGKIQVFASAKDYFGALFDRRVTPLRLATDEERAKLHDMLRTSMTGGISRALTSELRSFLLRQETGLADTLARMRANLEACRRTRVEVAEARALEQEIAAVHAAGAAMFAACSTATRAAAAGARAERSRAEEAAQSAEAFALSLAQAREEREAERARIEERLVATRAAIDDVAGRRARAAAAQAIAARLDAADRELARAAAAADEASRARAEATRVRDEETTARDRARAAYERAARGLGDLQAGLDELHGRAHAQRIARERLAEARRLLDQPDLSPDAASDALARVRAALSAVDADRARAERDISLRAVHEETRAAALRALADLAGPVLQGEAVVEGDGPPPYDAAKRELARLASLEHVASRRDGLEAELAAARAHAEAARAARARAAALGVSFAVSIAAGEEDGRGAVERALAGADRELAAREADVRARAAEAEEAARRGASARAEAERYEAAAPAWSALTPAIARLEARSGEVVRSPEDAARVRGALTDDRERRRTAAATLDAQRTELLREAEQLEEAGGIPGDLLAVRDALSADLLAARFEGSGADEAPWLEAALGPLAHALVVTDPGAAAEALAQQNDAPSTVWLVAEDDVRRVIDAARAHVGSPETVDVVVREAHALRVTRRPSRPVLGRDARARRARELRGEAEALVGAIAAALEEARRADALVRDADRLLADALLLASGDPSPRAEAARRDERDARSCEADALTRARAAEAEVTGARSRRDGVRALLADARLLASDDAAARVAALERASAEATAAAAEIARSAAARAVLAEAIDALRTPPVTAASIAEGEKERARLAAERDRLFSAEGALVDVVARSAALSWDDLDAAVADAGNVRAALAAQHDAARADAAASEERLRAAESSWERTTIAWQAAEGERSAREGERARVAAELAGAGGPGALDVSVTALDDHLGTLRGEHEAAGARERELAAEIAVAEERRVQATAALARARRDLGEVEHRAAPAEAEWRAFAELAEAAGVLDAAAARAVPPAGSPAEIMAEARAQRGLLLARLDHARGGADGAAAVRAAFARGGEAAVAYLDAWLAARAWVIRRLPTQFVDVADPADALARLRTDLASLEARVQRHESDLHGASEDVARGIDVQLRKTATRVRRLNRDLAAVAFGSIGAVRVQVKRVERMELVLRALRGGEVQELLFQSDLPFEEALSEVFRRYGGGGKAGSARILDYREYLDLVVEVQRRSSGEWEVASPTRLSTGEAIGVGAALMMVVLTEWERDANMLRSDRPTGTLRFLFLDEANRLSPDNLAVLFDLCHALDLQLLVAAPEVARAHGNTTYRLVRHVDASGREEVLVSGRRAVSPPAPGDVAAIDEGPPAPS